jgi:DNA-binding HxlR family transcriptional regulator
MTEPTKSLTNRGTLRIASILRAGPHRLGEIERALTKIGAARYMLRKDLERMERDGIIVREVVHIGPPARIAYRLTDFGRDFGDHAANLLAFLDRHQPAIEASRQRVRDAREAERARGLIAPAQPAA